MTVLAIFGLLFVVALAIAYTFDHFGLLPAPYPRRRLYIAIAMSAVTLSAIANAIR